MLAKRYRLRSGADFRRVRTDGRCWSTRRVVLCTAKNREQTSRFGFSVSKRIGNAVVRNRVKRQLRECIRPFCDVCSVGWDVVLIARAGVKEATYAELESDVSHLLGRARLLSG